MAKDYAKRLKLPVWDIEVWTPEVATSYLLDVIASSIECESVSSVIEIARQLSGYDINGNFVHEDVLNLLQVKG